MDLTISYESLADIYTKQGKFPEAMALYQKVIQTREIFSKELGTPDSLRALGLSYERIADIYKEE